MPGIDEMVSRLRNVSETLHWVAAECKKPPTVERVLEVFEALKTTDDALPIIEFGKQMGVPDAQDVRQSLASTLINALGTGRILAAMHTGRDVDLLPTNAGPEMSAEWEPKLEALYQYVDEMRAAIAAKDFEKAWAIGGNVLCE